MATAFAYAGSFLVLAALFVPAAPERLRSSEVRSLVGLHERQVVWLFVLAVVSLRLAWLRRPQHSWVVGLLVAAIALWVWLLLEAYGSEIRPWPWLLLGAAVTLLGAASWWWYRADRRERADVARVFE